MILTIQKSLLCIVDASSSGAAALIGGNGKGGMIKVTAAAAITLYSIASFLADLGIYISSSIYGYTLVYS